MTKKIKLVLSGSGALFPVFAGAIMKLSELGYEISEVCGTSGGSIMAAALASGYKPSDLPRLIRENNPARNRLIDPSILSLIMNWGLIKGDKLEQRFNKMFVKTFKEAKIPLHIVTTNIERKAPRIFSSKTDPGASVAKAVRASMGIPGVFAPTVIEDEKYVDGGVVMNYALDLFGAGQDVIGLRFGSDYPGDDYKSAPRSPIKSVPQYIMANIDAMIEASSHEHMDDAIYARTIFLKSKFKSLNLLFSEKDSDEMLKEGYMAVEQAMSGTKASIFSA
jgi:NTE family protein